MTVIADIRDTWRSLRRSPYFTIPVVLSLAFAIGTNVAAFSIVNALVLRPLPVHEPDRLFQITYVDDTRTSEGGNYAWFEFVRDRTRSVSAAFIAHRRSNMHVVIDGRVEAVTALQVSGGYASGLGLAPQIGRLITTDDERGAAPNRVAMISDAYWTSRFGRSPDAIGRTITIDSVPHVVIGVTRPEFFGVEVGRHVDVTVPIDASEYRTGWVTMALLVRLPAGVSSGVASQELTTLFKEFASAVPARARLLNQRVDLANIATGIGTQGTSRDRFTRPAVLVSVMLGMMLLLACSNWATLLLARASARRREMAIQLALGSDRFQLGRRLVIESVSLALAGGALGLLGAVWLAGYLPGNGLPATLGIETDIRVLVFAVGVTLFTGATFAAAPVWLTRRIHTAELRGHGALDDGQRRRFGTVLVAAQVALSVMIVVAAAFFSATLRNLRGQEMGFSGDGVVAFTLTADGTGIEGDPLKALHMRILERLRTIPGVRSATLASVPPLSGNEDGKGIMVPGFESRSPNDLIANVNTIGPEYFDTFGIPVLRGRAITDADAGSGPQVALVSASAARYYFGNQDPIGRRIEIRGSTTLTPEVVGIAGDVMYDGLRSGAGRMFYVPFTQRYAEGDYEFAVRTTGDPAALLRDIPGVLAELAPQLPVLALTTMSRTIDARAANERLLAMLSGVLGLLALVMAGIGIYGTVAYTVARRTPELGLRVVLGATRRNVTWLVTRSCATVVAIGVIAGLAIALASSSALTDVLYGLERTDVRIYAVGAAFLFMAGILATIPPVLRALRIQPVAALRYE